MKNNNFNYSVGGIKVNNTEYTGSLETGFYNPKYGSYEAFVEASRDYLQNKYREDRTITYHTVDDDGTPLY